MNQKVERKLRSLAGVGPSIEADLNRLGIRSVEQLASSEPDALYEKLCAKTKSRQDPCVLDTFRCAVAQARDPDLPVEQRNWWWWSRQRKMGVV
jgi:predicted RecB family nuclease